MSQLEQFEEWASRYNMDLSKFNNFYSDEYTRDLWEAWKASRNVPSEVRQAVRLVKRDKTVQQYTLSTMQDYNIVMEWAIQFITENEQ